MRRIEKDMAKDVADTWQPIPRRPARDGEICSCGRPAVDVVLTEDLGPVPSCGTDEAHRPPDCPPWCVQDHRLPHDRRHASESHAVPLDGCPWQERVGGKWQTRFQSLLAGLAKEPNGKPSYIEIIGADDQLAGHLTAHEAEQLADILRNLAATLRDESHPTPTDRTGGPPRR